MNPDRLELLAEFKTRDPQLEAIGMMLLAELKQENINSKLYIESLSNVLAVHLLRHYATAKHRVTVLSPSDFAVVSHFTTNQLLVDLRVYFFNSTFILYN